MDFRLEIKMLLSTMSKDEPEDFNTSRTTQATGTSPLNRAFGDPFDIVPVPGKGMGAVSNTPIPKNSILLQELPIMSLKGVDSPGPHGAWLVPLIREYTKMSPEHRSEFMALHAFSSPSDREERLAVLQNSKRDSSGQSNGILSSKEVELIAKVDEIFQTNSFGASVYIQSARFNHSCVPNIGVTLIDRHHVLFALRNISVGEELTVCYIDAFLPRDMRIAICAKSWGFFCQCPVCDEDDPSVDTVTYEANAAEYRKLKDDPCILEHGDIEPGLSSNDVYQALERSKRRQVILEGLPSEHQAYFEEYLIQVELLMEKWARFGDESQLEHEIDVVVEAKALAESRVPLSDDVLMAMNLETLEATLVYARGSLGQWSQRA